MSGLSKTAKDEMLKSLSVWLRTYSLGLLIFATVDKQVSNIGQMPLDIEVAIYAALLTLSLSIIVLMPIKDDENDS